MISAFANTLKIPELRDRILFTLAMVVIVRVGVQITLPGVDPGILQLWIDRTTHGTGDEGRGAAAVLALLNVFSGGGLNQVAIFALGVMPYISASIMMQLLTAVVPQLSKIQREDGGRQKINQFTRYGTIILCLVQSFLLVRSLDNPGQIQFLGGLEEVMMEEGRRLVPDYGAWFIFTGVLTMTAGTVLLMWLGEQITERGIGNGISLIIAVNIVFALPSALVQVWTTFIGGENASALGAVKLVMLVAFLLGVIAAVIAITQGQRRIVVQYAKRTRGRKQMGGVTQYMPLKVNYSGVMPIIFAQAILLFPTMILAQMFPNVGWLNSALGALQGGWPFYVISGLLIFFFSYFWVATMFKPAEIADDLKRAGGYVPGHRPGKPTAEFLDKTMSRLTFAGAVFLTLVYVLPSLISGAMGIPMIAAQFFGGTSLLILVGVLLDVMRQVETHLIQRHYDGFLRKGKIRGRTDWQRGTAGKTASKETLVWLWVGIAVLMILGMAYSVYRSMGGN